MRKAIGTIIFVILALGAGCNRHVDSLDPVRDLPSPLDAPLNVQALIGNQAVTLSWDMTDVTGVAYYRVYVSDSIVGEYQMRDTSAARTKTLGNLLYNQTYFFKVAAVRSSGAEGVRSSALSVRIPAASIVINDNDEFTKLRSVGIGLTAGVGATQFQLSEDSLFTAAPIQTYSTSAQLELSNGDGLKRVYAGSIISMVHGPTVQSTMISFSIRALASSHLFFPDHHAANRRRHYLYSEWGRAEGKAQAVFEGSPNIELYDDGVSPDAASGDGIYTGRWTIPVGLSATSAEVTGKFTDAAGNESAQAKAPALLTIRPTPQPVSIVSTVALSTYQIEVIWTQATASNFMSYRLYRDLTANVTTSSELLTSPENRASVSYTDTALNANTKYFYRVFVIDSFGLSAGSNVDSARTQVNTAPAAVTLAGALSTDSSTFKLSWTRSGRSRFCVVRLYRKNSPG